MTKLFEHIPKREVYRLGWQDHFKHLAETAKETSWGLTDELRWQLGLCVQLEEALTEIEKIKGALNKMKGLQLENGRLRKKITKLEAEAAQLAEEAKAD